MNSQKNFYWLRLIGAFTVTLTLFAVLQSVNAQLVPDHTLGAENSKVTPQGVRDIIEGGARRGSNLFHSFTQFNVGNTQQVYFANPAGIANILTRVTGNNVSKILGTLGVEGTANLFLINPNGIIFGPGARLDISGSFVASTADGIKWGENEQFSATQPQNSTLLSIQPGVLFSDALRQHQAEIRNQGSLSVGTGQTLTLQADSVTSTGSLNAPGGTVEVLGTRVSLLKNASLDVSAPTSGGTVVIGNGQIKIGSDVRINADALNNGNGGTVSITSEGTTQFEGHISARGGENSGNGGLVEVSGGNLQFTGAVDTSALKGTVGTLLLDPKDILIQRGGTISGQAVSQSLLSNDVILQANNDITVDDNISGGAGNNLTLQAGRSLSIADNRSITLNGGNFSAKINDENALPTEREAGVAQFVMNSGSQLLTKGGNVEISSGSFGQSSQIDTANGAIITSISGGNSGNISLFALGDISTGRLDSKGTTRGSNGGDITIKSIGGAIAITNSLSANSLLQAGDISVDAAGNLSINGDITSFGATPGKIALTSGSLLSATGVSIIGASLGSGTPNDITLTTNSLLLENATVYAATTGGGQAGNILVNSANDVVLRNSSIANIALSGSGSSGNITLNTEQLTIITEPGAIGRFSPSLFGVGTFSAENSSGNTGNVTINALDSIEIVGDRPGAFNPIPQQLSTTLLQANTGLTTLALGSGNSGNLTVNTGGLVVRDRAGITTFPSVGKGGDLTVNARDIFLQGEAGIGTSTLGGDAGTLTVNADQVTVTDGAVLGATTFGTFSPGNGGTFNLSVGSLSVRNGSLVGSSTLSLGDGGTTTIEASDFIEVVGISADGSVRSGITTNSYLPESGNAGALSLTTDRLIIRDGGEVATATVGQGQGAALTINTRTLQLDNGRINASTSGSGNGGNITIHASDSVDIIGTGFDALQQQILIPAFDGTLSLNNFNQGIVTATAGQGKAGNVLIETSNFIAQNGGLIATTTLAPSSIETPGKGGDITINASSTLVLDNSLFSTGTFNKADAGDIYLSAHQLLAKGGAQALTTTFGSGKAGNLTVNVSDSIDLIDPSKQGFTSGLFASSAQTASGNGGDINISTGDLNIRDGAAVSVSAEGTGNAGDVNINARSVFLDNGSITATSISGEGGNINLRVANNLILRNNSQISTRAGTQNSGGGDGGNININAKFVVAIPTENSDITANAYAGKGGNINLTAQSIFGLQVSDQLTPKSDITASSQLGIDGTINIKTPDVDPSKGLTELPSNLSNSSQQIVAGCPAERGNRFVVTGRGGIPDNPSQYLRGRAVWQDSRNLSAANRPTKLTTHNQPSTTLTKPSESEAQAIATKLTDSKVNDPPLIEAQGWMVNENGTVILTTEPYGERQGNSWIFSQSCEDIPQ